MPKVVDLHIHVFVVDLDEVIENLREIFYVWVDTVYLGCDKLCVSDEHVTAYGKGHKVVLIVKQVVFLLLDVHIGFKLRLMNKKLVSTHGINSLSYSRFDCISDLVLSWGKE